MMTSFRHPGTVLTDRFFSVPLDHQRPDGEQIEVFAREVVAADKADADLPWLLFLQGGPGFGAQRPEGRESWLDRALHDFRVLLLDQRGTGRSCPANRRTLTRLGPQAQADYLTHFRADSIVLDAELIRRELTDEPWSVLGQSFGGMCTVTYLSFAPHGIREAFITGGPLYALLHEAAYAQGLATRWSAQRIRAEFGEFDPRVTGADPLYFTGEMIYPWMIDADPVLRPLREAADILAERDDWPPLYDPTRLAANEVPVAAVVYYNDMYVDREFSMQTAQAIRGLRTWVTSEYEHDGLRVSNGAVLNHLFGMCRGNI